MPELAPITDYVSLKNAIIQMADRSDAEYVNSVPVFIQQAETKLFRQLRCPGNEAVATYLATGYPDNIHGVMIPNNYLEAKWMLYGDRPLERITDQEYLRRSQGSGVTPGCPTHFARIVDQLLFHPHAGSNEDVRLGYYEAQGPLSSVTTWTKMLRIAPFAYMYGALAEGARFIRDQALVGMWDGKFMEELMSLNDQAMDNEIAGSTVVVTGSSGGGW